MYYDRLAHTVEHHFPQYEETVREARLFRIVGPSTKVSGDLETAVNAVAKSTVKEWEPEAQLIENFLLPFPTIALENATDRYSGSDQCLLFHSLNDADRKLQFMLARKGSHNDYISVGECLAFPDGLSEQGRLVQVTKISLWAIERKKLVKIAVSPAMISKDKYAVASQSGEKPDYACLSRSEALAAHQQKLNEIETDIAVLMANMTHALLMKGILELCVIVEPTSFIVEESPLTEGKRQGNAIVRSHHRPHYIVLKPKEIRRRLGLPDVEGGHVTPHERRAHWRQLSADRYKKKEKIKVRATWVGPREAVVGKNRYVVLFDV